MIPYLRPCMRGDLSYGGLVLTSIFLVLLDPKTIDRSDCAICELLCDEERRFEFLTFIQWDERKTTKDKEDELAAGDGLEKRSKRDDDDELLPDEE